MVKASFTISGKNIREEIIAATEDFQRDEFVVSYDFESGTIFMSDQFKRSVENFALNVIVDFTLDSREKDELLIQCVALGGKNRGSFQLVNLEKSILVDFRAHFFGYRDRKSCEWEISELNY